jgi:hypothetical protein
MPGPTFEDIEAAARRLFRAEQIGAWSAVDESVRNHYRLAAAKTDHPQQVADRPPEVPTA